MVTRLGRDTTMVMERVTGVVASWSHAYGFLRRRADRRLVFVHCSDIPAGGPLAVGGLVEFTPVEHPRGPRAVRVRRLPPECPKCGEPLLAELECRACGFTFV